MFCSNCGVEASGKFCFNCGHALHSPTEMPAEPSEPSVPVIPASVDWENEVHYERLVRVEIVREVIAQHAANAPKGITAEALLDVYDKVASSPIPLNKVVSIVQPMYASWGIRTGKNRVQKINAPIGRTMARVLCSLARHSQTFQRVEQGENGCVLTADLPSSVCSLKGEIQITLERKDSQTQVKAETNIPGQMFDWGKSQRCLDQLFRDLADDLGLPPRSTQQHVA